MIGVSGIVQHRLEIRTTHTDFVTAFQDHKKYCLETPRDLGDKDTTVFSILKRTGQKTVGLFSYNNVYRLTKRLLTTPLKLFFSVYI